jgi:hypothetical protein
MIAVQSKISAVMTQTSSTSHALFCGGGTTMVGDGRGPRQPADTTIAVGVHAVVSAQFTGGLLAVAHKRSNTARLALPRWQF